MSTPNIRPSMFANQRRSQRLLLTVPVRVSGKRANGTAFAEYTNTLIVNAHGALIHLKEPVKEGQTVAVKNVTTGEELACTVVDVNPGANEVPEVGLEFATPSPRFWRVSFPPADWSTRSPEAKRFTGGPNEVAHPVKTPAAKK
jgi:hypothetical protein